MAISFLNFILSPPAVTSPKPVCCCHSIPHLPCGLGASHTHEKSCRTQVAGSGAAGRHEAALLPTYPFDKDGEREIVDLDGGDIYIFRGDLIHVGAEYDTLNIRIHCFIDSPSALEPRDPEAMYKVREGSWPIGRQ